MPLLHISLKEGDTDSTTRNANIWHAQISHGIASDQPLILREAFIHTVYAAQPAIVKLDGSNLTGKTCLFIHVESGDGNVLKERQIVSNVRGGSWLPIPMDYEPDRASTQHYTGLNQALIISKGGIPHNIKVTVWSDLTVSSQPIAPDFDDAANCIDKIDLVFEYIDYEQPHDAN